MAEATLRSAVAWVMESPTNSQRFRVNAMVIKEVFPDLSDDDMSIMERISEQSSKIELIKESDASNAPLEASNSQSRSYGW